MGPDGLVEATKAAILSRELHCGAPGTIFPILYKGSNNRVAHEYSSTCASGNNALVSKSRTWPSV